MSLLVADCPRCGSVKVSFDLLSHNYIRTQFDWQHWFEAFCVCRHCHKSVVFFISQSDPSTEATITGVPLSSLSKSVNDYFKVEGFVSIKNLGIEAPPDHIPPEIHSAFIEGVTCLAVSCPNAAVTMFRLCVDHATRALLPGNEAERPDKNTVRILGKRLEWLFTKGLLPQALKELSSCIKEDGNDGAHEGIVAAKDAEDVKDFTALLLERLYTEPKRLELAIERQNARRAAK